MQHASTLMTFSTEKRPQPIHKTKIPKNSVISLKDRLIWVVKFCKLEKTVQLVNQNFKRPVVTRNTSLRSMYDNKHIIVYNV